MEKPCINKVILSYLILSYEVNQILPPKKSKIKSADTPTPHPPQKLPSFSFPPQKKSIFFSKPLQNIQKTKCTNAATPSEMTFKAPSENLIYGGGGD